MAVKPFPKNFIGNFSEKYELILWPENMNNHLMFMLPVDETQVVF